MTTSIGLSQSQAYFSVSRKRFTPSWNYTRSLSSRSQIEKHSNSFHYFPGVRNERFSKQTGADSQQGTG